MALQWKRLCNTGVLESTTYKYIQYTDQLPSNTIATVTASNTGFVVYAFSSLVAVCGRLVLIPFRPSDASEYSYMSVFDDSKSRDQGYTKVECGDGAGCRALHRSSSEDIRPGGRCCSSDRLIGSVHRVSEVSCNLTLYSGRVRELPRVVRVCLFMFISCCRYL